MWNYPSYYLHKQVTENQHLPGITMVDLGSDPISGIFPFLYEGERHKKALIQEYTNSIFPFYIFCERKYNNYASGMLTLLNPDTMNYKGGMAIKHEQTARYVISFTTIALLALVDKLMTFDPKLFIVSSSVANQIQSIIDENKVNPESERLTIGLNSHNQPVKNVSGLDLNISRIKTWQSIMNFVSETELIDITSVEDDLTPFVSVMGPLEIDSIRIALDNKLPLIVDDEAVQMFVTATRNHPVSNVIPVYMMNSQDTYDDKVRFINELSKSGYHNIIYPGLIEEMITYIVDESKTLLGEGTVLNAFSAFIGRELRRKQPADLQYVGLTKGIIYLVDNHIQNEARIVFQELLKILGVNFRVDLKKYLLHEYRLNNNCIIFINDVYESIP